MASGVFVSCRAPEDVADGAHVQAALQTFLDNAEDVANVDAVNQLEAFFRDQLGIVRNRTVRARVLRVEKDRFKVRVCLLPSVLHALPALPACIDERFVLGAHAARAAHGLVQVLCCPRPAGEAGQARQPRGLPFEADCGFSPAAGQFRPLTLSHRSTTCSRTCRARTRRSASRARGAAAIPAD